MNRYQIFTQTDFGFPERGKAQGLMKVSYISFYNAITYSLRGICPIEQLVELSFDAIRRKNSHFNLLMLYDGKSNLPTRISSEIGTIYAYSFLD